MSPLETRSRDDSVHVQNAAYLRKFMKLVAHPPNLRGQMTTGGVYGHRADDVPGGHRRRDVNCDRLFLRATLPVRSATWELLCG